MTLIKIPVILLVINIGISEIIADTKFFTTNNNNRQYENNINPKSRAIYRLDSNNDDKIIHDTLKSNSDKRNSFIDTSTFDTDVLNKFLDEYANKIKITTENTNRDVIKSSVVSSIEIKNKDENNDKSMKSTTENILVESGSVIEGQQDLNDTAKRNKFYNGPPDDRNGWVTLEAVPWSKSKISKWQANPSSHRPWPETTKWDKPNGAKPWQSDYPQRPSQYQMNKPWNDKPTKPQWQDYDQDRPRPPTRPSYFNDRYDVNPSQAQKWPPERPNSAWEDFQESYRPTSDIITDNRPSNFPTSNNWNKYDQPPKPSYGSSSYNDRYQDDTTNDWPNNNYHNNRYDNIKDKPSYSKPQNRPFYSNYEYENHHPPSHPSSGDGEWVLLSTNRGYAKSRQRSMNFDDDSNNNNNKFKTMNNTSSIIKLGKNNNNNDDDDDGVRDTAIPSMTSKRQVRLTVLPSINGTNTTTSHGGLLEVEETFKTVDQSQQEYEDAQKLINTPIIIKKKPSRNSFVINSNNNKPSNSAVLAAVGAGMLPATMAMVLPLMLGRKKRSIKINLNENNYQNVRY